MTVPAGVFINLAKILGEVLTTIVEYSDMMPLERSGYGVTGQPLAAISISLWSLSVELKLETLSSPFVINMTVEGRGLGLGAFTCDV